MSSLGTCVTDRTLQSPQARAQTEHHQAVIQLAPMDTAKLQQALDDVFDQALLRHGFVDYMRDYEVIIYATADHRSGIAPTHLRYLFRYCVQAHCNTTVPADVWQDSLDDRLTNYETGVDLDGYVWGVNWHLLYPGASLVADSAPAQQWGAAIGIDFHEIRIQTNAHDLTLVFSDLQVQELPPEQQPVGWPGGISPNARNLET
jgi:hypothetical protein